jgi:hypothetical protein
MKNDKFVFTVILISVLFSACKKEVVTSDPPAQSSQPSPRTSVAIPPPPPKESPIDKIQKVKSFADAVNFALPSMSDTFNETSPGTILFLGWAGKRMKWEDVYVAKNETSFAKVLKDSQEERGKRLCAAGMLIEIKVERTKIGKINEGILTTSNGNLYRFHNVDSSGELVARKSARMCGIVIGKFDYSNSAGGTGHAIQIVGVFDLPENKKK